MASPRGKMSKLDWKKIGTSLLLAVISCVLAWVVDVLLPMLRESGDEVLIIIAGVVFVIVNAVRKWLTDTRPTVEEANELQRNARPSV